MRGETKPVQNFLRKKVLVIGLYRVAVGAAGRQPALQGWERASFHSPLHRLVNQVVSRSCRGCRKAVRVARKAVLPAGHHLCLAGG